MTWHVTNSELETARRCMRKWYLSYVEKLEPAMERLIPPRLRGTLVHTGLAIYYETGSDPLDFIKSEGVRLSNEYLERSAEPDEEDLKQIRKVVDLAHAMVEGYMQWVAEEGVDQGLVFLGPEKEMSFHLGDRHEDLHDVHILGKLDERFRREQDGFVMLMDHKTVGNLTELPRWAQINTQVLHYNVLWRLSDESLVIDGATFNMLRSVKRTASANPPFYGRHEVRHNRVQLNNYYTHMISQIKELIGVKEQLQNGADHHVVCPPTPQQDCHWSCPFFTLCPMMDDGSDYQGLIGEAYKVGDPIERYVSIEKG